jgi:small-conductance mechanosensitive channel
LRILRPLILMLALAWGGAVRADDPKPLDLGATSNALGAIEATLKQSNLNDVELQRLRADNDQLGVALQAAVAEIAPRFAASAKRLAELTPKKDDKDAAPATDAATAELAAEQKRHDAIDANLRTARALLFRVDDNASRIGARRRDLFARATFARSSSIFDPQLWVSVSRELPSDVRTLKEDVSDWASDLWGGMTGARALSTAGTLLLLVLVTIPIHWIARRVIYRDPAAGSPSRLRRALAAGWTILVLAALPLLGIWALAYVLDLFSVSEPRTAAVRDAVLDAAGIVAVINAVGRGMLAPHAMAWRLIPIGDQAATRVFRGAMMIAVVAAIERLIEPAADAVASFNIAVAGRAVGAALIALVLTHALRRLAPPLAPGQTAASAPLDRWGPVRSAGWTAVFLILAAVAAGYIAFITFVINQVIFLAILGSALYLVDIVVHDGAEILIRPDAAVGAWLKTTFGLRRNVLAQIAVVLQGLARVVVVVIAAAAVLEPWGVQSQDWFSSLRAAYFGFGFGGVTLSLSSMLSAAIVFAVALTVTRVIQAWLSGRLLPQTRFDAGVSNSISTIFGYVGGAVAILLAAAQVGLDLQKIAIVAGALSVGIGFGLQSIANNFVSGLILLWERGIRVGDIIAIGADQGFVRKISARATEIETFDRATLIVPNSNFITGVVKNWVHSDRIGRVIVAVNVAYESDVEAVREILIGAAKAQDLVLSIPAPIVLFSEFNDWSLRFELICFVDDVEMAPRIRSDVNFDVLRRLREAKIRIPYPAMQPGM